MQLRAASRTVPRDRARGAAWEPHAPRHAARTVDRRGAWFPSPPRSSTVRDEAGRDRTRTA
jgi:hypothetical protein